MENSINFPFWVLVITHRGIAERIEPFSSFDLAQNRKEILELTENIEDDDISVFRCNEIVK